MKKQKRKKKKTVVGNWDERNKGNADLLFFYFLNILHVFIERRYAAFDVGAFERETSIKRRVRRRKYK